MSDPRVSSVDFFFFWSAVQRLSVPVSVGSIPSADHVRGSPFLPALSHIYRW